MIQQHGGIHLIPHQLLITTHSHLPRGHTAQMRSPVPEGAPAAAESCWYLQPGTHWKLQLSSFSRVLPVGMQGDVNPMTQLRCDTLFPQDLNLAQLGQ